MEFRFFPKKEFLFCFGWLRCVWVPFKILRVLNYQYCGTYGNKITSARFWSDSSVARSADGVSMISMLVAVILSLHFSICHALLSYHTSHIWQPGKKFLRRSFFLPVFFFFFCSHLILYSFLFFGSPGLHAYSSEFYFLSRLLMRVFGVDWE